MGFGCFGACAKGDSGGSSNLVLTPVVDQPTAQPKSGATASVAQSSPPTNGREEAYKPTSSAPSTGTEAKAAEASGGNTHQGSTNTDSFVKPAASHSASAENDAGASNSRSGQARVTGTDAYAADEDEDEDEARDVVPQNPGVHTAPTLQPPWAHLTSLYACLCTITKDCQAYRARLGCSCRVWAAALAEAPARQHALKAEHHADAAPGPGLGHQGDVLHWQWLLCRCVQR